MFISVRGSHAASSRGRNRSQSSDAPPLAAVVREVAASADAATRTYQIKLSLPAQAPAALGATATVSLAGPPAGVQALKLPTSAVMQAADGDRAGSMVWVFDAASGTVKPQPVVVAGADGNEVVIASGLHTKR